MGEFPVDYTYVFTDKDKFVNYHNGTGESDLTKVKVTNSAHGSQTNPYVIANAADWENFVKYISTDTTSTVYGEGEFFVLADDIDFSSVTNFHTVPVFCGTFYGLGHTLSNITSDQWKTYNDATMPIATTWGWGLFCRTYNAVISDLIVKDFAYKTFPQGKNTHENRGSAIGGIAGYSTGTDYFLNCHTSGSFYSHTRYTVHVPVGGILGAAYSNLSTFTYRCSAETTVEVWTVNTSSNQRVLIPGAVVGENYSCANKTYLYDCAGNMHVTDATGSYGVYASVGVAITGRGASVYIDGLVGKLEFKLPTDSVTACSGSITGAFNGITYMSIQNAFAEGVVKLSSGYRSLNAVAANVAGVSAANPYLKNVHYTKAYEWATYINGSYDQAAKNLAAVTQHTSSSDMLAAAKSAVGGDSSSALKSYIWNADRIGGTYEPENSPVRNYLTVVPEDVTVTYTGEQAVFSGADWYADSVHGNTDIMTVTSGVMINANKNGYNVTFNLQTGYYWNDGTSSPKTIKVIVKPKKLSYGWDNSNGATVAKITGGLVAKDAGKAPKIIHTYYEQNGTELAGTPQQVGDYRVSIRLPEGSNYTFKENESDPDPSVEFPLNAIPIATPTVSGNASVQYTGEPIVFTLANTDQMGPDGEGYKIETHPSEVSAGATYRYDEETGTRTVTATAVGTYEVKFALYDQTNNCWSDGSGILTLTIEPFPIEIYIERDGAADTVWEFETNTNESFTVRHNALKETDNIQYSITYEKPNGEIITVGSNMLKQDPENARRTIVTLDPLDAGRHVIRAELAAPTASNANGNYSFEPVSVEQEVNVVGKKVELNDSDIIWQYSDGRTSGLFSELADNRIEYNGRTVTASIKTDALAAKGVRVKEYVNGEVDGTEYSPTGLNAGAYKTKVVITRLNESYNFTDREFEIGWEITKAVFDLSNVKWDCTGEIGYTGKPIKVQLINVPAQLTATYLNNIETQVNQGSGFYTSTVRFKPKNEADKDNYYVPSGAVSGGTYKYDKGDEFPWELRWRIVKGVIDLNWDLDGKEATGAGGYEYTYPTLLGGGDNVEYRLYKEINGAQASNPTDFSAVAEPAANTKEWYYVTASLKPTSANNFEFGEGSPTLRFAIGDYRQAVKVTVTKSGGMYDGEPHPIEFTSDSLSRSDFEVTYLDENGVALPGAPVNAGRYTAKISVKEDKADGFYVANRRHEFEIEKFKVELGDLKWDYDPDNPFVFTRVDGEEKLFTVKLLNVPKTLSLIYTKNEYSAAGTYTATVSFGGDINGEGLEEGEEGFDFSNFDLENFKNASGRYELPASIRTLTWTIEKRELTKPVSSAGEAYNGSSHDLAGLIGLDEDWAQYMTLSVKKGSVDLTEDMAAADYLTVNAGTYTITCTAIGSLRNSVIWSDGTVIDKTVTVKIDPLYIKLLKWEGKPATPVFEDGAGASYYKIVYKDESGALISSDAVETTYNTNITASVEVSDEMEGNVFISYDENVETTCTFKMFKGNPTPLDRPTLIKPVLEYNFESQEFAIKDWRNYSNYVTVLGANGKDSPLKVDRDFIGKRTVLIALNPDVNYCWKGDIDKRYEVVELVIEVVACTLPQVWDFDADGRPVLSFGDSDLDAELLASLVEYEYYEMDGTPVNNPKRMKKGVDYKAVAVVKDDYAKFFCFGTQDDGEGNKVLLGSSKEYEFTFGDTDDPGPIDPGDDGDDKKPSDETLNIPLWQVIVSAICTVLFVVCLAKSYGNLSKAKAARNEAKELASQSYAANYSFAPLPLLAVGTFLGMGETPWTIIAGVTAGLFLLSAVLLFITSKKRKAAELALKREQARVAEEKEYAREEEQRRRDNEMKMMFAAMQQGGYGQAPAYDDAHVQNLIASTVSALLPAVQQQMALPPAQSDPNAYAQPGYVSPEAEMLRAQMAEQQARMEEQMARQQEMMAAQMAQQQELINRLLQNQAAPAYEEEEEIQDDISWLGESDEIVSLEESYGALSDEGKRAYYEIGSYIMGKPRTSQNDGRYAVLFKYRGRTVFKLCIKDDAPVLYYPAGGGRAEVRVADATSLEIARSMIDRTVSLVDSELK